MQKNKDSLIIELNEQLRQLQEVVTNIEDDCQKLSVDIIRKFCKRAVQKMNRKMSEISWASSDDYPASFSFFDILSIEYQSRCLDDINPHLEDYIISSLDCELNELSNIERLVMCNCSHEECGYDGLNCNENGVWDFFISMLNEHYSSAKISKYMEHRCF